MSEQGNVLMLIDGNSILNRAFYGLQGGNMLQTVDGLYTNAIYGFLNILNKYVTEDQPDYLAVAFDLKAPTFRHKEYAGYKAQRKGMPPELACQVPVMKEVLDAMQIARFEIEGYEADDIIGTLSKKAEEQGMQTVIVTGDKDSFQLVSPQTTVKSPVTKGGKTETDVYTPEKVVERYGSGPAAIIDIKGLMGDPSDNIPGVPGVGEKTAVDLIKTYGTIENIYAHIDEITKKALKEKLIANEEMAHLSKHLATILREVPLTWDLDTMRHIAPDNDKLYTLFQRLQFKSMIKKYGLQPPAEGTGAQVERHPLKEEAIDLSFLEETLPFVEITESTTFATEMAALKAFLQTQAQPPVMVVDLQKDKAGTVQQITMLLKDYKCITVAVLEEGTFGLEVPEQELGTALKEILPRVTVSGHDVKSFVVYQHLLGNHEVQIAFDTALAMYVIDPSKNKDGVPQLAERFLGVDAERIQTTQDKLKAIYLLQKPMEQVMEAHGQTQLYREIELPLVDVLAEMEYQGFFIDTNTLGQIGEKLDKRIAELTEDIHKLAGDDSFNINSPKQLGVILFERLGLKSGKKSKSGYSTSAEVLEEMADQHPVIPLILEYRQVTKLKSTYIEGLQAVRNPITGKIHSSFNQTVTVTGRLSSTEPNLQNIPVRMELGREIRKAFLPSDKEHILLDADYSQIELRVLAHITEDTHMCHAFLNGQDIHTRTASQVFGIPYEEVPPEVRSRAKAVNFGIVYGIGDFSLGKDLGITRKEARAYIDQYLENFSGVREYMKNIIAQGKADGYVTTMFGRRRYVPELSASNFQTRAFGERVALNTPIQGAAADIIKIAMIQVYKKLKEQGLASKLILQVHDELIIDTLRTEQEQVAAILKESMETAAQLKVPLVAEVKMGENWFYAK